jgi:hypothetical protein
MGIKRLAEIRKWQPFFLSFRISFLVWIKSQKSNYFSTFIIFNGKLSFRRWKEQIRRKKEKFLYTEKRLKFCVPPSTTLLRFTINWRRWLWRIKSWWYLLLKPSTKCCVGGEGGETEVINTYYPRFINHHYI